MFFQRILGRSHGQRMQSTTKQRRLRIERLLSRDLLAADFGAIGGTVFNDLQGNGLDGGDQPISGATVRLFIDTNANGTFDAGVDANVQTAISDAQGEYLFDRLAEGRYFVQQTAVAGRLQDAAITLQTVDITAQLALGDSTTGQITIDGFDGATQEASDPAAGLITPTSSAAAAEAVGGERDLSLNRTSPGGSISVQVNGAEPDVLAFQSSLTGAGSATVQWDGADGDANTLDATGLQTGGAGLDFTAGNASGVLLEIGSDQPGNTATITFYTDAANFSSAVVNIPDLSGVPEVTEAFTIPFTSFVIGGGTGADFTDIGAIEADITIGNSSDIILNVVGAITPGLAPINFANAIPMTLGNLIFNDTNNSGTFDAGESGINGVTVNLFEDTNANGVFDAGIDTQVGAPTVTAGGGLYTFTNLFPGDYLVQVPASQFALGNALNGFQSSLSGTPAPDPDNNTNSDDNGEPVTGQGVVTGVITLVSLDEPTSDGDADNNTNLTLDLGFAPQVDVSIVKTVLSTNPVAGQDATYRLSVANAAGSQTATNTVVTDTLPAGVTLTSITRNGVDITGTTTVTGLVATGLVLTLPATTLTAGQTESIDITVGVPADGTGAFNNIASVASDGVDIDLTNNSSNVDLDPDRIVDLVLLKTVSDTDVTVGESFSYTITVSNVGGPSTATGVTVTDTLPTGLTFDSGTINRGGVITNNGITVNGSAVTVSVGDLAVAESVTITINVTAGTAAVGVATNDASVTGNETDSDPNNNDDDVSVTVSAVVDLVLDKQAPANATAGDQLTYTILVTNNGPATATGVSIVDTLPTGVTFVQGTGGTFNSATPGQVTVAVPDIAAAATATVTMIVNVPASAAGTTLTNTAAVISNEVELPATIGNESDTVQTPVVSAVDLTVTKTGQSASVVPGNQFTYTIVVDNLGPSDASGVVLSDTLPTGLTLVSISENGTDITNTATINGQAVSLALGNVAVADPVRTFTYVVGVASSVVADISNTASVTSNQQATEVSTANNSSTVTTTVTPNASLVISKSDSIDPATPGSTVTYTITVQNTGPSDAGNVVVADTLPTGVTVVSSNAPGGTGALSNGILTLQFGTVTAGATATATVTVQISGTTRGSLSNVVNVSGTGVTGGTLTDTETTALSPQYDVTVTQTANTGIVAAGDTVTFNITVLNATSSVSTATGVILTNTLPAGLTFSNANLNGTPITNLSSIAIPDLAPGATASIQVSAIVDNNLVNGQTLSNTANVTTAPNETNVLTNNSSAAIQVDAANRSISGRVVVDSNFSGALEVSERDSATGGIEDAVVVLRDSTGAEVDRVTTGTDGTYAFANLLPDTYTVTTTLPAGTDPGDRNLTPVTTAPGNGATATGTGPITVTLTGTTTDSEDNDFGGAFPFSKWIFFV